MRRLCVILLWAWIASASAQVPGTGTGLAFHPDPTEKTNTVQLYTQATLSFPACSMWHPSGICFFLWCRWWGCTILTTPRFSHLMPDVVVSTYHDLDNHPWPEVGIPIGQVALRTGSTLFMGLIGDSAGTRSPNDTTTGRNRHKNNSKYRDADAIGHPGAMADIPLTCNRAAIPFMPYYSSFLDGLGWRDFINLDLLRPEAWIPGLREVGAFPLSTWGSIFPRTGWVVQQHDVKNAAVLSQRVADIITNLAEPHVYFPLRTFGISARGLQIVWNPPLPARENLPLLGGLWQLSAPIRGPLNACHIFGLNDSVSPVSYGDLHTTKTQSYAYTLWRPYACCYRRGMFLFYIQWGLW